MGNPPPLRVDTPSLNWDPADVTVPPVPLIPAGPDPMSLMISAFMPALAAPLTAAVAATHAREEEFSANLAAARSAYQFTDDAGEHEIQTVSSQQLAAAEPAMSGSANTSSSWGDLMSTAMPMGSQAAQAPMQMMGIAASGPQSVIQGAQGVMQQMGQLPGQTEKPAEENDANGIGAAETRESDRDNDETDAETAVNSASPGSSNAERVPAERFPAAEPGSVMTPPRFPTPQ